MRTLKNKILITLLVLISAPGLYSVTATVDTWGTALMEKQGSGQQLLELMPGAQINVEKTNSTHALVTFKKWKGYIRNSQYSLYGWGFSQVKSKPSLADQIMTENGKSYLYYYLNGKVTRYNTKDRLSDSVQNVRGLEKLISTPRQDVLLVEGVTTNGSEIHNFAFFHFSSGKLAHLISLPENIYRIENIAYTENADTAAISWLIDGMYITCLYRVDDGTLLGYARNTRQAVFVKRKAVFFNKDNIWAHELNSLPEDLNLGYTPAARLYKVRPEWLNSGKILGGLVDSGLTLQTPAGVLALSAETNQVKRLPYPGLEMNESRSLSFYWVKLAGQLKNLNTQKLLSKFSGNEPAVEFISFCRNLVLGRSKYEKIDTLFLYSEDGQEYYRYKAVEDPQAVGADGTLAEITFDKNLAVIAVENPSRREFYYLMEKEQD